MSLAVPYREFFSIVVVGLFAGIASGILGIGGGVLVVPTLIYVLGFGQHDAQGTTLALMCMPAGVLAAFSYHPQGFVDWRVATLLFLGFLIQDRQFNLFETANRLLATPLRETGGQLEVPMGPGLGINVNEAAVAQHATEHWVVTAIGAKNL